MLSNGFRVPQKNLNPFISKIEHGDNSKMTQPSHTLGIVRSLKDISPQSNLYQCMDLYSQVYIMHMKLAITWKTNQKGYVS